VLNTWGEGTGDGWGRRSRNWPVPERKWDKDNLVAQWSKNTANVKTGKLSELRTFRENECESEGGGGLGRVCLWVGVWFFVGGGLVVFFLCCFLGGGGSVGFPPNPAPPDQNPPTTKRGPATPRSRAGSPNGKSKLREPSLPTGGRKQICE